MILDRNHQFRIDNNHILKHFLKHDSLFLNDIPLFEIESYRQYGTNILNKELFESHKGIADRSKPNVF